MARRQAVDRAERNSRVVRRQAVDRAERNSRVARRQASNGAQRTSRVARRQAVDRAQRNSRVARRRAIDGAERNSRVARRRAIDGAERNSRVARRQASNGAQRNSRVARRQTVDRAQRNSRVVRRQAIKVPKETPAWLDDKPSTVPKEIPAWLCDKLPNNAGRNPESLEEAPLIELEKNLEVARDKPSETPVEKTESPRTKHSEMDSKYQRASKEEVARKKYIIDKDLCESISIMNQDKPTSIFRDGKVKDTISSVSDTKSIYEERELVAAEITTAIKEFPSYEGGTQTARDFLRNYGNPWMLKKFSPLYWPIDVKTPINYYIASKSRVSACEGDIDQIMKDCRINLEEGLKAIKSLKTYHHKGIILPIGLWPEAIEYLLELDSETRRYKLNSNALNLIKSGKLEVFADNSILNIGDSVGVSNAVNKYLNLFGLTASKKGEYFDLRVQDVEKVRDKGARFVVPEVTDDVLKNVHADEFLSKYGNVVTKKDFRMMLLYGFEQIGWGIFTGKQSDNLLHGLTGGRGEWLGIKMILDKEKDGTGFKGRRISDICSSIPEEVDLSIDSKKVLFKNGKRAAEIDILDALSEWNGATRTYKTAIARGIKLGHLDGKLRTSIYDNVFNLLSCAGKMGAKNADLINAISIYDFDIAHQDKVYGWNELSEEFMSGKRKNENKELEYIHGATGEFVTVFKKSSDVSVGVYKKLNDETCVRYEIKQFLVTSNKMDFEIKSEVGIIDESAPDCYGDAATEPKWLGKPDKNKWDSPISVSLFQDLESSTLANAIAYDIEIAWGGRKIQSHNRSAFEHIEAYSSISRISNEWMIQQLGLESLDNSGGTWIHNGALTRRSLIWMEKGLMEDSKGGFLSPSFMEHAFGNLVGDKKHISIALFDACLKDDAFHLQEYEFVTPITFNGRDFATESFYTTESQEVVNEKIQRAQETVNAHGVVAIDLASMMVGGSLGKVLGIVRDSEDAASINDEFWHDYDTINRIVEIFEKTARELKDGQIFPVGITEGYRGNDIISISESLRNRLNEIKLNIGSRILVSYGECGYKLNSRAIRQAWLDAWGALIEPSINSYKALTGEVGVLAKGVFDSKVMRSEETRIDTLATAIMKASFIGFWVSSHTMPTLSEILYQPSKDQFNAMCLNHKFDILEPGFVLGDDGYYYARIKWFIDHSTDHIPREYIVSFAPSGNININGFYVYTSFSINGIPDVASPNHLYSSIPSSQQDNFMKTVRSGKPIPSGYEYLLFRPGASPYWMWDLIDASYAIDGTQISPSEDLSK